MIEISDETAARVRARRYMRKSLGAFVAVANLHQRNPRLGSLTEFGGLMAAAYREFRAKNKFYEAV